jgi:GNAT superfamily N-acetyltransferase
MLVGTPEEDTRYLKKLSQCKDAIAVLIFDGPKIVGVTTGVPLEEDRAAFQKPFRQKDLDPADYYYFGCSALLKDYRGRGIAHHFFDVREQHVKHLKRFKKICFATVVRPKAHPKKPDDHMPLDTFWKKRGYVENQDLTANFPWREPDEKVATPKRLNFWIKEASC